MAKAGDVLENQATGEKIVFRQVASDVLEYELTLPTVSGFIAQEHLHPKQEERHEVLEGRVGIVIAGDDRVLEQGDVAVVRVGTAHRLRQIDGGVRLLMQSRPALRSAGLIETFASASRGGKPGLLQLAALAREFEHEGYTTRPPLALQRVLFAPLAALSRLRGR